jgi:transcriptional regulator with XRE-family HTH domain
MGDMPNELRRLPTMEIGGLPTRLKQAVKRSGLGQNEFARAIGYDPGEFSKLLRAQPEDQRLAGINANVLIKAAHYGRVRVGWLIAGENPAEVELSTLFEVQGTVLRTREKPTGTGGQSQQERKSRRS